MQIVTGYLGRFDAKTQKTSTVFGSSTTYKTENIVSLIEKVGQSLGRFKQPEEAPFEVFRIDPLAWNTDINKIPHQQLFYQKLRKELGKWKYSPKTVRYLKQAKKDFLDLLSEKTLEEHTLLVLLERNPGVKPKLISVLNFWTPRSREGTSVFYHNMVKHPSKSTTAFSKAQALALTDAVINLHQRFNDDSGIMRMPGEIAVELTNIPLPNQKKLSFVVIPEASRSLSKKEELQRYRWLGSYDIEGAKRFKRLIKTGNQTQLLKQKCITSRLRETNEILDEVRNQPSKDDSKLNLTPIKIEDLRPIPPSNIYLPEILHLRILPLRLRPGEPPQKFTDSPFHQTLKRELEQFRQK